MEHAHSLQQALMLAEALEEDRTNYAIVRELKIQLRACAKDQEEGIAA